MRWIVGHLGATSFDDLPTARRLADRETEADRARDNQEQLDRVNRTLDHVGEQLSRIDRRRGPGQLSSLDRRRTPETEEGR